MTIDFRASQVQTNKIIASGSTGTGAKLLVYGIESEDSGLPNQGYLGTSFATGSIGTDILVYISGTITASSNGAITVTGGDLLVSGSLMSRLTKTFVPIGSYTATSATSSNPEVAGQALFSIHEVPSRNVFLRVVLSTTDENEVATAMLYNVTSGVYVDMEADNIETLTTYNTTPTVLESWNLASAGFAANFDITGSSSIYEVRVFAATGSVSTILGSAMFVCGG